MRYSIGGRSGVVVVGFAAAAAAAQQLSQGSWRWLRLASVVIASAATTTTTRSQRWGRCQALGRQANTFAYFNATFQIRLHIILFVCFLNTEIIHSIVYDAVVVK